MNYSQFGIQTEYFIENHLNKLSSETIDNLSTLTNSQENKYIGGVVGGDLLPLYLYQITTLCRNQYSHQVKICNGPGRQ